MDPFDHFVSFTDRFYGILRYTYISYSLVSGYMYDKAPSNSFLPPTFIHQQISEVHYYGTPHVCYLIIKTHFADLQGIPKPVTE